METILELAVPVALIMYICVGAMFATIWREHWKKFLGVNAFILSAVSVFAMINLAQQNKPDSEETVDWIANHFFEGYYFFAILFAVFFVAGCVLFIRPPQKPKPGYGMYSGASQKRPPQPSRNQIPITPAPPVPNEPAQVSGSSMLEQIAQWLKRIVSWGADAVRGVSAVHTFRAKEDTTQDKNKGFGGKTMKIDYSQIDYKKLYIEKYRMLPIICFFVTLVAVGIIGILEIVIFSDMLSDAYEGLFSIIVGSEEYISGILALVIWGFVAYQIARFVRYITAIALSQRIVVADTLLANARAAVSARASAPVSPVSPAPAAAPPVTPVPPVSPAPAPAAPVRTPAQTASQQQNPVPVPPPVIPAPAAAAPSGAPASSASGSGKRAVYIYSGHNADLYVYATKIVIIGKGYNRSIGEKTIPIHAISAVQMKASTPMINGCIEFNVAGEIASSAGGIGAGIKGRVSENAVIFASGKDDAKVRQIKEYIEGIIYSQKTGSQTIVQQTSSADELKKCKELLDMGIITQEEFDAKKKQLLGL